MLIKNHRAFALFTSLLLAFVLVFNIYLLWQKTQSMMLSFLAVPVQRRLRDDLPCLRSFSPARFASSSRTSFT